MTSSCATDEFALLSELVSRRLRFLPTSWTLIPDPSPKGRRENAFASAKRTFDFAVARSAGCDYLMRLILGLTPQALCCRPLRGLQEFAVCQALFLLLAGTFL